MSCLDSMSRRQNRSQIITGCRGYDCTGLIWLLQGRRVIALALNHGRYRLNALDQRALAALGKPKQHGGDVRRAEHSFKFGDK
jgi:hypothetical protein